MVIKLSKESMSVISRLLTRNPTFNNRAVSDNPYFGSVKELLAKSNIPFSVNGGHIWVRESLSIDSLNGDERLSRFIEERLESVAVGQFKWNDMDLKSSTLFQLLREHLNYEGYDLYAYMDSRGRMGDGETPHQKLKVHVYQMSNDVLSSSEFLNINQDKIHVIIDNIRAKIARGRGDDYEHAITDARTLLERAIEGILEDYQDEKYLSGKLRFIHDKFNRICTNILQIHCTAITSEQDTTVLIKSADKSKPSQEDVFNLFSCIMQFINKSTNYLGAHHPNLEKPTRADAVFIANATASFCIYLYDLYLIHKSTQAS